jgi:hypothetical protein
LPSPNNSVAVLAACAKRGKRPQFFGNTKEYTLDLRYNRFGIATFISATERYKLNINELLITVPLGICSRADIVVVRWVGES